MKFGIVLFPGSNCDHDVVYLLRDILEQEVEMLWHKEADLKKVDAVIIPGGFSYGDYLRAGAIARFSPIMNEIINFAEKGKFVFGICNGFQVLCESKLLPGALLRNANQKFICKNVFIKTENHNTSLTSLLPKDKALKIPISHGEGNYFADVNTLKEMRLNNQILFRYCDSNGVISSEANPNGSVDNIAGICNKNKNVFGMMPHPERAADDELSNTDGRAFFESIIKSLS
ncbi:MAG TPA: phosphoribosylformylglycinamidine synthase subunit PurQ [Bacteroidales bacterium]|jgi:phosphoribosylformylglycinamidine synthase|nr:phosphoribosylformylglycinamidine synthase subunit PurQ [Bacteroidales bacterium]